MNLNPAVTAANIFQSIGHSVSVLFHPIIVAFGTLLSWIYGVIPNYAIAISVLTLIIMGALTPLTIKATKSQVGMQEIQPEVKKLQQKYAGPENRAQLNEEMMALYKEYGVNPLSGCLPIMLQAPFLFILYSVIRGITNTVVVKAGTTCPSSTFISHVPDPGHPGMVICGDPKNIPTSSEMFQHLVQSGGQMISFGMDLSKRALSPHSSIWAAIPYFVLIALAVGLQYVMMWQIKRRTAQGAQAPAQMQMIQRIMPIAFAYIYFIVPAALTLYFVVSNIVRVITQDLMFRTGVVKQPKERVIPAVSKEKASPEKSGAPVPTKPGTAKKTTSASTKKTEEKPAPKSHPRSKSKRARKDR